MYYKFVLIFLSLTLERIDCLDFGKLSVNQNNNDLELKSENPTKSKNLLVGSFLNTNIKAIKLNTSGKSVDISFTKESPKGTHATVEQLDNNQTIAHYVMNWVNPLGNEEFCIHLSGDQHWYSTYQQYSQRFPIDKNDHFKDGLPFVSAHDIISVVESLFIGSDGFAFYVDKSGPLFMRRANVNGESICFSADFERSPYTRATDKKETKLSVHMLGGQDILHVYQYAAKQWIPKPTGIPDERMIKSPIWSTWAKYHSGIDYAKVMDFAKSIKSHGMPNSHLEIDDKWEAHYGDWTFDSKRFPKAHDMVKELNAMGFRTTLWVYPFVNTDSEVFKTGADNFIHDNNNKVTINGWWTGKGGHVDFSKASARDWYIKRLQHIKDTYGIDSFKFDAGELSYINTDFHFSDSAVQNNPMESTRLYVETAAKLGNMIEVRSAYKSQHLPIFVRMMDKDSRFGYGNGLGTLIPAALTFSLAGYPFVLPDMIGGNAYGNFPSAELYIRWLQVNTLMPTLQFSILPWDFKESSDEVVKITKSMLSIHEKFTPLIIELAKNSVKTGEPILRPVWWVAPNDQNTFTIDDEFMLGNDLLVAPVVTEKAVKRNIYLPAGNWKDQKGVTHKGGQVVKDFSAHLDELPYFVREK